MIITYSVFVALLPLLLVVWVYSDPASYFGTLAKIKRWTRRWFIQKYGTYYANLLAEDLRRYARKNGVPKELVEEFIAEYREVDIKRLGTAYANKRLGEPDLYENIF